MPKTRNHYKIGINLSRDNTIIKSIDVPFINAAAGQLDKVSFSKQKIVITAVRSKKFKVNDILSNKGNSLYQQILKSIIYLYVVNGERVRITKIRIERSTTRVHEVVKEYELDKDAQPITGAFIFRHAMPNAVIDRIWGESDGDYLLRTVLTHFIGALASGNRYYIFERHWRTFEQLCLYHNRAANPNRDVEALQNMRGYIVANTGKFNDAITMATGITEAQFLLFDWEGYVEGSFKHTTSTDSKLYKNVFPNYFVGLNTDERIVKMLRMILPLRSSELSNNGTLAVVQSHITTNLATLTRSDEQVLCILCCRYAYYLRNKIFHGELPDFSFNFSQGTQDDKRLDKINLLLEDLNYELLLDFNAL